MQCKQMYHLHSKMEIAYQQIQYFQILQSSQIIIETSYEIHKSAYMIAYKMQ